MRTPILQNPKKPTKNPFLRLLLLKSTPKFPYRNNQQDNYQPSNIVFSKERETTSNSSTPVTNSITHTTTNTSISSLKYNPQSRRILEKQEHSVYKPTSTLSTSETPTGFSSEGYPRNPRHSLIMARRLPMEKQEKNGMITSLTG